MWGEAMMGWVLRCPTCLRSVRLGEETAQFGDQVLGVVALHRVAGFWDGDEFAVGQALRQADAVLLVEHVALAAAHDQRRAGDAAEAVSQRRPLGAVLFVIEHLEAAAVVFPSPGAVGLL